MSTHKLKATKREKLGRKVSTLRAQGMIPANIYGKDVESTAITVSLEDFDRVFKEAGETGVVELDLAGETRPVLIDEVQVHPVTDEVLHIDFKQVNLKVKVVASVPVEFIGEAPAEKQGMIVVEQIDEIEVEALPTDLPEKFVVDVTSLVSEESVIKISDLDIPANVEVKMDMDLIVANVSAPQKEEEPVVVEEETPVAGEAAPVAEATPTEEK